MKKLVVKIMGGFINVTAVLFPKWNAEYSFKLLCKVKRVGISENGRRFLEEAETTFLDIDGHSAALHQWGIGDKKVLLLHGWLSNSQRWKPYVSQLDLNEYQVFALDAPGHGMAEGNHLNVEIYRKALELSIKKIGAIDSLVCHSLGSLVGGYAYLHNREIPIKRFVIMGSPSGMDAIFVYFRTILGLSTKAILNLERKINSVLKLPHESISLAHFFQKVNQPVLVIHDMSDKVTPFEPIRVASEKGTEITTFFTSGQDHNLKGEDTVNRVIQFIKE
ncbi:MAG: alpha/beta hydrolase [Flavobacteriaceae bacterium]|nr:alpha/beta hydrolase [Flavobacteriaceae bacterium]